MHSRHETEQIRARRIGSWRPRIGADNHHSAASVPWRAATSDRIEVFELKPWHVSKLCRGRATWAWDESFWRLTLKISLCNRARTGPWSRFPELICRMASSDLAASSEQCKLVSVFKRWGKMKLIRPLSKQVRKDPRLSKESPKIVHQLDVCGCDALSRTSYDQPNDPCIHY